MRGRVTACRPPPASRLRPSARRSCAQLRAAVLRRPDELDDRLEPPLLLAFDAVLDERRDLAGVDFFAVVPRDRVDELEVALLVERGLLDPDLLEVDLLGL